MVNEHFLSSILIIQPWLPVSPEEEINGRMSGQRVQRRLSETGDDCSLSLDGNHFGEIATMTVARRVVDLIKLRLISNNNSC